MPPLALREGLHGRPSSHLKLHLVCTTPSASEASKAVTVRRTSRMKEPKLSRFFLNLRAREREGGKRMVKEFPQVVSEEREEGRGGSAVGAHLLTPRNDTKGSANSQSSWYSGMSIWPVTK